MGIVSDHLNKIIQKQIDDHGIVVWYDPEKHYSDAIQSLSFINTTFVQFTDSFFALRHEIESLLDIDPENGKGFDIPPRLLVYVPLAQMNTENALVEVEAYGVILKPGQQPPERNTNLAYIARHALLPILAEEQTTSIEADVREGRYTLNDLDQLAERGEGLSIGQVTLVYSEENHLKIALKFLTDDSKDKALKKKDGVGQLAELLDEQFGTSFAGEDDLDIIRHRLKTYVLMVDFVTSIEGQIPARFASVHVPEIPFLRDNCIELMHEWRDSLKLQHSYVNAANEVEQGLSISADDFSLEQLAKIETFASIEHLLQGFVEQQLLENPNLAVTDFATGKQTSFWSHIPEIQARWALITDAGQLLIQAERIEQELKQHLNAEDLIEAYTANNGLYLLDTHHRHMEKRWHQFDVFETGDNLLERLMTRARQRYMEVGALLSQRFIEGYEGLSFNLRSISRQTDVFDKHVQPMVGKHKIAYILVDALRYEMAHELINGLSDEFDDVTIEPVLAAVPTITEIGMAALMPNASSGKIIDVGGGKLAIQIGDHILKNRSSRIKYFEDVINHQVFVTKLEDIVKPSKRIRENIDSAKVILVTSQEIDQTGEAGNTMIARQTMDDVLDLLRRGIRQLSSNGCEQIIVVADHGHIFGDDISDDMRIASPGGITSDIHRRAWVGKGGTYDQSYIRAYLSNFGLQTDLEYATPSSFAVFRVSGGHTSYFHGGLSLQELLVPVVRIATRSIRNQDVGQIKWELTPGTDYLSRITAVTIGGSSEGLFAPTPPRVRLEIHVKKNVVSKTFNASYGFEPGTGSIQLKTQDNSNDIEPNSVILQIMKDDIEQKTGSIYLIDDSTGEELAHLKNMNFAIHI